jgi:hypothetical protein
MYRLAFLLSITQRPHCGTHIQHKYVPSAIYIVFEMHFGNIGGLLGATLIKVIASTLAIATPVLGRGISAAVQSALISDSLTLLRRDNTTIEKTLNLSTYPDAIVELDKTFATVVKIPDDVLKQGDNATAAWLTAYGHRGGIHADSFWQKTECALAILAFLGSNLVAASKIIKIEKYIEALGGVAEAVELMLKCSTTVEMLRKGALLW